MNSKLWEAILAFDLDDPSTEYGFSTRLARENYWTKTFTQHAILEYKKFMYLATISSLMVSPSGVVDAVWHQHLIFTNSYAEFCAILGKQIQHVPSTHNREEALKFRQAKERTEDLYRENFGEQPPAIWEYAGMYESLRLAKAKLKLRSGLLIAILLTAALLPLFYFLLKPLYIQIDNPYFLFGFATLAILVFGALEVFNRDKLKSLANAFDKQSFVFQLQPTELLYLQTQNLTAVINCVINELVEENMVLVNPNWTLEIAGVKKPEKIEELQTWDVISAGKISYGNLLYRLKQKAIFSNIASCMDALKKYVSKSKKFTALYYLNFACLAFLFLLGCTRLLTGFVRDKPVGQISFFLLLLLAVSAIYLHRLPSLLFTKTIPAFYRTKILTADNLENSRQ